MLILLWEGDREGLTHRSHNCWIKHILKVPGLRSREWKLEAVSVPGLQTEWLKVTESCYCLIVWRPEGVTSRCQQDHRASEGSKEAPFLASPRFGRLPGIPGFGCVLSISTSVFA